MNAPCELCDRDGGRLIWKNDLCRVVRVPEADYPATVRVIANHHAKEVTDLSKTERMRIMEVVFACEEVMIAILAPAKMNLASLGNLTPHVHWHLIARRTDDRHFPRPIWGQPMKDEPGPMWPAEAIDRLERGLATRLTHFS